MRIWKKACYAGCLAFGLGIVPTGSIVAAQKAVFDSPTPEVLILGVIQEKKNLRIKVEIRNFKMNEKEYTPLADNPSKINPPHYGLEEQRPNFGHIHVYLSPYNVVRPASFRMVDFLMVDNLSSGDVGEFLLQNVKPGRHRLLVELVKHDHAPRLKAHSQDFPSMDMVNVTIGEPK